MSLRLTALLCALCLLTGCGAQSSAPAVQSTPAESQSVPAQSAASTSESAEASVAATDDTPWVESDSLPGGKASGLEWSFARKRFPTTESSGREVYYYEFVYPVFSGLSGNALNEYLNSNWLDYMDEAEAKSGVDDSYLDDYKESMDAETLESMLPFYDMLKLDTVWANEKFVSISGLAGFWSGGAHPYSYRVGAVLRRSDALALSLDELIDTSHLSELVREHFPEDTYADDPDFRADTIERIAGMAEYPESYVLEEDGLRLYYNIGDALPRLEVFLPMAELTFQ